jgi:ABC-2 type transporter
VKPLLKPRRPNYPRWVQREIMGHGPNDIRIVSEYYRPLRARLVALIEKGISAGEFRRGQYPHAGSEGEFGVLNTLLYFPSGAIYPIEGFPVWLRWISYIDPFTYAVHALKALLLKDAGFQAIYPDVLILKGFSIVLVSLSVAFFKRQI